MDTERQALKAAKEYRRKQKKGEKRWVMVAKCEKSGRFLARLSPRVRQDNIGHKLYQIMFWCLWQVEVLDLPKEELEAYRKFEKALQKQYLAVRHRLLTLKGSHTMAVLTLLSKFRQVSRHIKCCRRATLNFQASKALGREEKCSHN